MFYSKWNFNGGLITNDLVYRTRNLSGTTWSSPTTLAYTIEESGNAFNVTKTTDDNIHVVIYPEEAEQSYGLVHRTYNGSSWSSAVLLDSDPSYGRNVGFTSVSNDLFLTFMRGSDNYLRYKQNNQTPLAPQNLTVVESTTDHPILIWSKNNEADLNEYIIDRAEWGVWANDIARTTSNSYSDLEVFLNPIFLDEVSYRVRAVDKTNHISLPSNVVTIENAVIKKKRNETSNVDKYELNNAYPNPFNPSTKISYSIKEEGLVTLKIYDILGKEIATLVNENKPAGIYEVEFNASALPSGMYIYKIQSGSFTDVKKMLLTK